MMKSETVTKGKRVKFWVRFPREGYDEWKLVWGEDGSNVPIGAWKAANKLFWDWKSKNAFFPLDALEAYEFMVEHMIRIADRVRVGVPSGTKDDDLIYLVNASVETYLVSSAVKNLLKYKERVVDSKREEYRAMFDGCRVEAGDESTSARGEDKADREWSGENRTSLDVQAFAEALPGIHSAEAEQAARLAAECVYATLAKLDADTQLGLRAWIQADGVWIDAAKIYNPNGSVQGYVYRFKVKWAPAFRAACEWRW